MRAFINILKQSGEGTRRWKHLSLFNFWGHNSPTVADPWFLFKKEIVYISHILYNESNMLFQLGAKANKQANQPGTMCDHQHCSWQSTRPESRPRCPLGCQSRPSSWNQRNLITYDAAQGSVAWSAVSGANSNAMQVQHAKCAN